MSAIETITVRRDIHDARIKRLWHVQFVVHFTLLILFLLSLPQADPRMALVLGATTVSLFLTYYPLCRDKLEQASSILIGLTVCCVSLVMWEGEGLRSTAALAYPGVLIFCVMLGNRLVFLTTYVALVSFMVFIVAASHLGWRTGEEPLTSWYILMEYIVVVTAVTYVIKLLAGDLFNILTRVDTQMQRVMESHKLAQHLAYHDVLTGLPNRSQAETCFQDAVLNSEKSSRGIAMLFMDLDNFKIINDTHGHLVGDDVLQGITKSLSQCLRKTDTLIRLGGDEFLLITPEISNQDEVLHILDKISLAIGKPVLADLPSSQVSFSIGVVLAPQDGSRFSDLLNKADIAMYQSKAAGRNQFKFFADVARNPC